MMLSNRIRQAFSLRKHIYDTLYISDPDSRAERIARSSIYQPANGIEIQRAIPKMSTWQSTKLPSGITVLTESSGFPSNVHMGIFLDVGTRDESAESSGSMLSIKNTYLKTALNTNETVNYGIVQMAGGECEMDFNRENAFYRVNCLSHDVVDVFSMLADCAFEPKNFVAANVGIYKNEQTHKLDSSTGGNQNFNDQIYSVAFGKKNLGNLLYGSRNNVANLTGFVIQKFQSRNYIPNRIVITASGIENHQEFVDLVSDKMFFTQLNEKSVDRDAAKYEGGEVKSLVESSNLTLALTFEGANYANSLPLLVATEILGNQRRSGRIQKNLVKKHAFISGAEAFNANYSDTGLFGLKISGSAAHAFEIANAAARELSELRNISEKDLEIAKNALKNKLSREYVCDFKRLEDNSKSLYYLGRTNENWSSAIDKVSVSDVTSAVSASLKTPLTVIAHGGEVNKLPTYETLIKTFN